MPTQTRLEGADDARMEITIFKKSSNPLVEEIDIETSFNLWNLLVARYASLKSAQLFKNFVHDRDLAVALDLLMANFKNQIRILEEEVESAGIPAPYRPPLETKTTVKVDEITDRHIFDKTSGDMLVELFSLARAVRTTLTSDRLRKIFTEFLFAHLRQNENLFKYGKLKGWVESAPAYKTTKPQEREALSVSDAFHIWDHIQKRYHQLQLTMIFRDIAHDPDFRASLIVAMGTLEAQLSKLEKLATEYEVTLPERPPSSMRFPIDPEPIQDRLLYTILFSGVDGMVDAHIRACIEVLRNDGLRSLFMDFFQQELVIHNAIVKYGKMKGWLIIPPIYGQGTVG